MSQDSQIQNHKNNVTPSSTRCKICNSPSTYVFNELVLDKYIVAYFRCVSCGFMQTEEPVWMEEAYSKTMTDQDVGLVQRNLSLAKITKKIIVNNFDSSGRFLDWGGGYGLFTRLMRDEGFDFYHYDPICENMLARGFDRRLGTKYELITCFEVIEHLREPMETFKEMLQFGKSVLFTQELIPESNVSNWIYLAPEHGQHISFYSQTTLEFIAKKFGLRLISNGSLHLLTDKTIKKIPSQRDSIFRILARKISNRFNFHVLRRPRVTSLTGRDFRKSRTGRTPSNLSS